MWQDYRKFVRRVIGALAALLVLMSGCTLLFADRWRYEADQPRLSDAMIVLAGAPERPRYAANLYRLGYAPIVYVSLPSERSRPPEEEVNRDILLKSGVPEGAIRTFSVAAENTLAEARVSSATLPAGVKTVLVVTSPKHVRRARMIFTDVLSGRGVGVTVVATPDERNPGPWWSDKASARQSVRELIKAVLYTLGIRYSE